MNAILKKSNLVISSNTSSLLFSILLCCLLHSGTCFAQPFCNFSGIANSTDEPASLIKTYDGGFALAGKSDSNFVKRAIICKYNAQGVLTWSKILKSTYSCEAYALSQSSDSALLIAGYVTTSSALSGIEILLAKIKMDGTVLFQKKIGNNPASTDEAAYAMTPCADGSFVLACQTNKNPSSAIDLMLVKVSASGSILWVRDLIDSYFAELPVSIKSDAHNNLLLSGYLIPTITSNPMFYDMFLTKLDSSGHVLWAKTFGGSQMDYANDMQLLNSDAGYAICGRTESYHSANSSSAAYLVVLDTSGQIKWSRTFNYTGFELVDFYGLSIDANNEIVAAGLIQNFNNNDVSLLVKYNASGSILWTRVMENFNLVSSSFRSIVNNGSGYTVCGKTNRFNLMYDPFITSISSNGYSCCTSDSLSNYVIDSGFTFNNWTLFDTLTNSIVDNGSFGVKYNSGSTSNYCILTQVPNLAKTLVASVYPNPSKGNFDISWEATSSANLQLSIFNSLGKIVYTTFVAAQQNKLHINIENEPQGLYLIKIRAANFEDYSQLLIKD